MMIYHFKGDKVTETWQMADNYKFLMQIGAIVQPVLRAEASNSRRHIGRNPQLFAPSPPFR